MSTLDAASALPSAQPSPVSRWFHGPLVDLAIGCGAWTIPLLLLGQFLHGAHASALGFLFYVLSLLCNYPHYMATIYRAYGTREDFSKYRFFTVYVTAVLVLIGIGGHMTPGVLPWILTAYLTWSPWHYSGQNFGLAMMFARRNGATPTRGMRNWLYVSFLVTFVFWIVTMNAIPMGDPNVLTLGLSERTADTLGIACLCGFAVSAVLGLGRLVLQAGLRAMLPTALILATQVVWFVVPAAVQSLGNRTMPAVFYATGVVAFMHCAQYLWVTSYYAKREALAGARGAARWRPWQYYTVLVLGGAALFVPGPWIASRVFNSDFVTSVLIFQSIVNLHHFMLDGAIWKLRDGRIAQLLIGGRERVSDAGSAAISGLTAMAAWIAGGSAAARTIRWCGATAIIGFASIDAVQSSLIRLGADLPSLYMAERLNPNDQRAIVARSRILVAEGMQNEAVSELEGAVARNPRNALAQRELGRLLADLGRVDEALERFHAMEQFFSPDVGSFINGGILAMQTGRREEALERLHGALRLAPRNAKAMLELGNAYALFGDTAHAQGHLEDFFEANERGAEELKDIRPEDFLAAYVHLAQCYLDLGDRERAARQFAALEEKLAHEGDPALASRVLSKASFVAMQGKDAASAGRLCLRSIVTAERAKAPEYAARGWANYAEALAGSSAPKQLVFAAYLNAERMLVDLPRDGVIDAVTIRRHALEQELDPATVASIRADPAPTLREARDFFRGTDSSARP